MSNTNEMLDAIITELRAAVRDSFASKLIAQYEETGRLDEISAVQALKDDDAYFSSLADRLEATRHNPDGNAANVPVAFEALNENDRQRKVVRLSTCDIGKALRALYLEEERRTKYIWMCRDGREIDVKDMSDEHLANTIAMLERKIHEREIVEENLDEVFG